MSAQEYIEITNFIGGVAFLCVLMAVFYVIGAIARYIEKIRKNK